MLLRSSLSLSLLTLERETNGHSHGHSMSSSLLSFNTPTTNTGASSLPALRLFQKNVGGGFVIKASKEANNRPIMNISFEPFEEVKKELLIVPTIPQASLSRHMFSDESEVAINEQIKDNVALKGLAKFFKESSAEERQHAEKLMEYQNKRGGKVKLQSMLMPLSEFDHIEKGDALYAMELALSLEKLTNEKLLNLHRVESIKKISEYVAQLRRVGKGHGVWNFDQTLLGNSVAA